MSVEKKVDSSAVAQSVIVDPIKDAIRKSNEAERVRKRKIAELAAQPFIAEYKDRVQKLEADNALLDETCKSLQNSNESLRSANEALQKRIAELDAASCNTPEDGGDAEVQKKGRGKKA